MTQQSSQLRTLQRIFKEAIKSGKTDSAAKDVILPLIKLPVNADSVITFYGILFNAANEVNSFRSSPTMEKDILQESLQSITKLNRFFVENNIWNTPWQKFSTFLKNANYILLLDNLSNYYYSAYKLKTVDEEDLEKIAQKINQLLDDVDKSGLPSNVKNVLISHLNEILRVISRYQIDGTEGLQKVAKSMMTDLLLAEKSIDLEDQPKTTFNKGDLEK
ncbi:hypothetical protein FEK30_07360 [Picosynechococcus sp. PCC 11901]|uniref:hypothetical protein n=1 Tax=Picosynechococcus sp. PCC 11901 TaxID=2579791 RepID=UPI0010FC064E|nr:hypothetical protein [Picosynechococcus sp. PCC 11901]QCS49267.1 hypothetical protein FEK30_07360 [Picosynechococcus sp. PCC 11901]